jgi:hypothetical protein
MRHAMAYSISLMAAVLLTATTSLSLTTTPIEDPERTVTYLLDFVARSDCTFIRNGRSHAPQEVSEQMKAKYEYFKKEIKTPEDFIQRPTRSRTGAAVAKR